jgi:hypothetical protein
VIGAPFNDHGCLGAITDSAKRLVADRDPMIVELAQRFATPPALADWIRTLSQRDDDGDPKDGPRVDVCEPTQRLRVAPDDPNCVERAFLYVAVAELIDPKPVRQLATLDTPVGLHTFPIEDDAPVILDPRVRRNCLDCGVKLLGEGPVVLDARDAIDWTADLAETSAPLVRNGPSRVRRARNAIAQVVDEGIAPTDEATRDAIGWFFALAEQSARRLGERALEVVRTVALAIAELVDSATAHAVPAPRNAGVRIDLAPELSGLAKIALLGLDVGTLALHSRMIALGITGPLVPLVEEELNREGLTLGRLAPPRKTPLATIRVA